MIKSGVSHSFPSDNLRPRGPFDQAQPCRSVKILLTSSLGFVLRLKVLRNCYGNVNRMLSLFIRRTNIKTKIALQPNFLFLYFSFRTPHGCPHRYPGYPHSLTSFSQFKKVFIQFPF
jgi:hypothetical protein